MMRKTNNWMNLTLSFAWASLGLLLSGLPSQADKPPNCGLYTYRAEIVRVIDGDTVVANVDLGFDVWLRDMRLRLAGIDAPERNTTGAEKATTALTTRIEGEDVYICSIKAKRSDDETKDGFGRYFAVIHHKGWNINEWLLKSGLVCEYIEKQECLR